MMRLVDNRAMVLCGRRRLFISQLNYKAASAAISVVASTTYIFGGILVLHPSIPGDGYETGK